MQKRPFHSSLTNLLKSQSIFFCILCLVVSTTLLAQSNQRLAELYRSNDTASLESALKKNNIKDDGWRLFVNAIFMEEAEQATIQMMQAYLNTSDSKLQTFIRDRVSQYYSAKGYYETARKILEDEHSFREIVSIKTQHLPKRSTRFSGSTAKSQNLFGVQLGAFSAYANAETAVEKYKSRFSNTEIIQKDRNGSALYIVIIGDYRSRADAEKALPKINNTFNVNGYIIQY